MKNILIDIDGTVSDDIPNEKSELFAEAKVLENAVESVNKLYENQNNRITFFTARAEEHREVTDTWLKKNGFKIEYGDESIKCISRLQVKENYSIPKKEDLYDNGEVLKKMFEMEKNYLNQGVLKSLIRNIRGYLYFLKNVTIFLIIDLYYYFGLKNN